MIKIGVTACFMYPDIDRVVFGAKSLTYIENDMFAYLSRKGVIPFLIPDIEPELQRQFLDEADGFLFTGGVDVSPKSYGEEGIENNKWPGDEYRDQYELKIFEYAKVHKKPVYGICRGMQVLNVAMGGTLYQDLKTQTGTEVEHRDAVKYDTIYHQVKLEKDSLIRSIYGQDQIAINTVHHQGVKDLGKDLILEGVSAEDNLCEAFRHKDMDDHYILGVQWHPEFSPTLGDKVVDPHPLYNHFLEAVKRKKEGK